VAKLADKKIQGYKNLGNKISQKATQFGSDIAQGASDAVDAATAGYQQGRGQSGQGDLVKGKFSQAARTGNKVPSAPTSGQGTQPAPGQKFPLNQAARPRPWETGGLEPPARKGQAAREDLDAMLRIAGLR
jgi:hypothetical protein